MQLRGAVADLITVTGWVAVQYNGVWGSICNDGLTDEHARLLYDHDDPRVVFKQKK